jgi:aubergine-like protein
METLYISSKGLIFNSDVIYRVIRTDTVHDIIKGFGNNKKKIESEIVGKILICNYNNRTIRCDEIDWNMTPKSEFSKNDNSKITFEKYFYEQYKIKIQNSNQPLIVHKPKNKDKIDYYIPELLSVTGLTETMKKDFKVMRDLKSVTGLILF